MTPEKRMFMVEHEFWACANPKHRHATEGGAAGCLSRHPNPPRTEEEGREWWLVVEKAALYRRLGMPYPMIARKLGLRTAAKSREYAERWERHVKWLGVQTTDADLFLQHIPALRYQAWALENIA